MCFFISLGTALMGSNLSLSWKSAVCPAFRMNAKVEGVLHNVVPSVDKPRFFRNDKL